jgi:pimeloyl-ACP methyl ester carboxylesterase
VADVSAAVAERRFTLRSGLVLAARVHNAGAPGQVLALHGWLDNAASFDALAAQLPGSEIVALDLAGHGRSGHRPPGAWYHYVDYLDEVIEVLDQLGWARSVWLGHSLGGALLLLLAAAAPTRVERLVLIESGGPLGGQPERALDQLRRGLDDRARHRDGKALRVFADADEAVAARMRANGLSDAAARALVGRGLTPVPGGQQWASDPRLTLASPVRIDEAHIQALIAAVACPTLILLAEPALPFMSEADRTARLACLPKARVLSFPGHHHLHMETPEPLAAAIGEFIAPAAAGAASPAG